MITASVDNGKAWAVTAEERAAALEIVLLKQTYILPWTQFLYAEGREEELRLVFATHDVVVRGSGLETLAPEISAQRVTLMRETTRAARFAGTGPFIREIVVSKVEGW